MRAALLFVLLVMASCGKSDPETFYAHGYCWEPDPTATVLCEPDQYAWKQVDLTTIARVCGPYKIGCRERQDACTIISQYSEQEAAALVMYGQSHLDHERMHLGQGKEAKGRNLRHPSVNDC